jgi:hypothetical protein
MSNDKKETAVDYLIKNIEIALKLNGVKLNHMYRMKTVYPLYSQAKAMEKEQIKDAYQSDRFPCSEEDAEQYFNETYKQP